MASTESGRAEYRRLADRWLKGRSAEPPEPLTTRQTLALMKQAERSEHSEDLLWIAAEAALPIVEEMRQLQRSVNPPKADEAAAVVDLLRSALGIQQLTHQGPPPSPEYFIWHTMKTRCSSPGNKRYERYGGRGITVCERWQTFDNFLADMGYRPSPKHSIDRINNDGNYEPGNCRWATWQEQAVNKSDTRLLTYKGETLPMAEWARRIGLPPNTLSYRIRHGWPVDKAIETPRQSNLARKGKENPKQPEKETQ